MINDKEAVLTAKELKEYCRNRRCDGCPFQRPYGSPIRCVFFDCPCVWGSLKLNVNMEDEGND